MSLTKTCLHHCDELTYVFASTIMYGMLCKHVYPFMHNIHNMLLIPAHLVATLGSRIVQATLSLPSHRPEKDWFETLIIQSI